MARGLSRRTWLGWMLGWGPLSRVAAGSPPGTQVAALLAGFRRTAMYSRRYRANAVISALGVRIFSRAGVGGGYAAVETGLSGETNAVALQFSAGSWPERAAGLNRFGILREAAVEGAGKVDIAFAGFITSSQEQSLGEARQALRFSEEGVPVAVAWGDTRSSHVARTAVPARFQWTEADRVLEELLREGAAAATSSAGGSAPGFLAAMRKAGLSETPAFQSIFLHNGKPYELRTKWKHGPQSELDGEIRNDRKQITAEFQARYQKGDASGLPVRFDYHPRSFLRLTFEADPEGTQPIPELMAE